MIKSETRSIREVILLRKCEAALVRTGPLRVRFSLSAVEETMKIVIRVSDQDRARAWGYLVRNSPGTALPNNIFIVSDLAVLGLRRSGIDFTEISIPLGE